MESNSESGTLGKIHNSLKITIIAILCYGTLGIVLLAVILLRIRDIAPLDNMQTINTNTQNVSRGVPTKAERLKEAAMANGGSWLKVSQVADILGKHPDTVTDMIARGDIKDVPPIKNGESYKIPLESLKIEE